MSGMMRAEIVVNGLVQGVGYRYFVTRKVMEIGGLKGYVRNLYTGEVLTVVEGEKYLIEQLFKDLKIGPRSARVRKASIEWGEAKHEFNNFEVRF